METIANPSCNTSTLAPYVPSGGDPWNTTKVKHVFRRLGFGASQLEVDNALNLTPEEFIDNLVDNAFNLDVYPEPFWANWAYEDFNDYDTENPLFIQEIRIATANSFLTEDLRGRMVSFWMNHFVTELEFYFHSPYLYHYLNIIQSNCLGNFKDFVFDIGENSAMLIYLNGYENTENNPNENYARELFELFTLGEGNNYTQNDILEASRALTGYNHWDLWAGPIFFDESTFDDGPKTIFDSEGPWGHADVINLIFTERAQEAATFITRKLYRYFVSQEVDAIIEQDIIAPLAQTLIDNNFELVPMLKQLFKSEHFFDERALGVIIKSPFDIIFNYLKETGFFYNDDLMDAFLYYAGLMGQEIYDPLDVSGWQRDETWINSSTLTGRWQLMELYVNFLFNEGYEFTLVDLARDLTNDSNDPAFITQVMIDYFVSKQLHTASDYDTATDIFKWEVPQNYYDSGAWNLSWSSAPYQVLLLLQHIARMPEFQLK